MCIHTLGLGLGKGREGGRGEKRGRERCGVHDTFLRHGKSAYACAKKPVGMIRRRGGGSVREREREGGGGDQAQGV